jgi:ABC-type uncharacterized transport system involved in gliding motility auxiliary subunit
LEVALSRIGKVFLALSGLAFVILMVTRALFQEWRGDLFVPLGLAVFFLIAALIKDFRFYKDVFSMKTTKHGMNFGVTFLIVLVLLVAINFIGYVRSTKWDLTEEKLNSLSDQTVTVIKNLDSDLAIFGFFRGGQGSDDRERQMFEETVRLYKSESSKITSMIYDPFVRKDLQIKYNIQGTGEVVMVYKGKNWTVNDMGEEPFTNAIIRLSRDKNKAIYTLIGHKERDLESSAPTGASRFKKALEDSSYSVKPLNLISEKKVPEDADVLMVLGPTQPLFEAEIAAIKSYLVNGGRVLLAADPGSKSNLSQVSRFVGVDIGSDYVIDQMGAIAGFSAALAVGTDFSKTSDITNKFEKQMAGFVLSTGLSKVATANAFVFDDLVKSSEASFSKKEISGEIRNLDTDPRGPFVIGMTSSGKLADSSKKEFGAVVFGDSDFLSNQTIDSIGVNRDLALNSISYLAKDQDLISIRPKLPKGTVLLMTRTQELLVLFSFVAIPLLFFVAGFLVWLRRRGA